MQLFLSLQSTQTKPWIQAGNYNYR